MKKIFMVLIVLLIMIIPNFKVNALEDSFYEGEYISGEYMKKFKGNSGKYQQMKVFRRTSDNQPVYCIELWETLSSNKLIIGYDNYQSNHANISYSTWQKIVLIAYYGYGYDNHTDIKWYAITQFMIWQITSPDSNIYFTDTLNGNKITKYQDEMNEISTLINNHDIKPSFNTKTFDINYKENYTLTDTNNVLEKFAVKSKDNLKVKKNKNQLIVKANSTNNQTLVLINQTLKYNNNPIVYIDPTGQDVLAPGNYDPLYTSVYYNIPKSTVIINKMDSETKSKTSLGDAKLIGTKFQLLDIDKEIIAEKEVDKEGNLTFENIGYGKYYLQEISSGEGYLLNNNKILINIDENQEIINFYNEVIKNKIKFYKYIKNSLNNKTSPEKDAIFSIYNKNNEKVTTFITDENGYYELELPYGKYIVKQEKGLKNHYFVNDFEINIVEDGKTQTFNLYNEELTANIKIINIDFDSNLPILENNATFKIKDLETDEYITDENKQLLILKTNDLGITDFLTLSSGKYKIEQISSVLGYDINENIFYFEISDDIEFKEEDNVKYIEIIIPNQKQKSQIEIDKYTEYYLNDELIKKEKDNNISIEIYAKDDIYSKDGLKIYSKDEIVSTTKVKENKIITDLLMLGNYYLKNPIDNTFIEIPLDKIENKKIELLEKVYEYEKESIQEEIKIDTIENQKNINQEEIIIEVPNTFTKQSLTSRINLLFILIGLYIIKKEKQNEKD